MGNTEVTTQQLVDFINQQLLAQSDTVVDATTLLFKERVLDSITILDLIGYIEKHTGTKLREEDLVMKYFQSAATISEHFLHDRT